MHPDAQYFIISLCLMPDNFTRQGENAATQWINIQMFISWYLLNMPDCHHGK